MRCRPWAYARDMGLASEGIDGATGVMLANFPQAFSHIGLINATWPITESEWIDVGARNGSLTESSEPKREGKPGPQRLSCWGCLQNMSLDGSQTTPMTDDGISALSPTKTSLKGGIQ